MIDQSAAYDLLSHSHFTEKLRHYNFDEASVNWCKSYLGGRSQCVQVEYKTSEYEDMSVRTVELHKDQYSQAYSM